MLRGIILTAALLAIAISPALSSPGGASVASAAAQQPAKQSDGAARGLAFASQRCSSCHAVQENRTSPNPESPSFQDIANRPGVTPETMRQFLRSSHNFPAAMNFRIQDSQIRDLADYILTLKKAGYRPVM